MKPAEHATLQYILAHPGQTIAQIAEGMRVGTGKVVSRLGYLRRMGYVEVPENRIPLVTEKGARRAEQPCEALSFTSPITHSAGVSALGLAVLQALLIGGAMSILEISKRLGGGWAKHVEVSEEVRGLSAGGFVVYDRLVGLTDKGQRMANGDFAPAPRAILVPRGPATREAEPARCDVDNQLPASFRGLRGITHPPIPKPCEKPKGVSASAWMRGTAYRSPLQDAYVRGVV